MEALKREPPPTYRLTQAGTRSDDQANAGRSGGGRIATAVIYAIPGPSTARRRWLAAGLLRGPYPPLQQPPRRGQGRGRHSRVGD